LGLAETATEVISMKAGKLGSWEAASLGIPWVPWGDPGKAMKTWIKHQIWKTEQIWGSKFGTSWRRAGILRDFPLLHCGNGRCCTWLFDDPWFCPARTKSFASKPRHACVVGTWSGWAFGVPRDVVCSRWLAKIKILSRHVRKCSIKIKQVNVK
jgi:hypothetical protein